MDTLLTSVLIGFVVALAISMLRPAPRPEIVYVQVEPQSPNGGGCLRPLVVAGIVLFLIFAVR